MREIKFRAWDNKLNIMLPEVQAYTIYDVDAPHFNTMIHSTRYEVLQFTGLKDKNGKNIYEGDYFKNHQADINLVEWYCGSWCYSNHHAGALDLHNELGDAEIIGNYYENPELEMA